MLLKSAVKKFLRSLEANGRRERTIDSYQQRLNGMLCSFGARGITTIEAVDPDDLDIWVVAMRRQEKRWEGHPVKPTAEGKLSEATIAGRIQSAKTFFNWCVKRGYLKTSPAVHLQMPNLDLAVQPDKLIAVDDLMTMLEAAEKKAAEGQDSYNKLQGRFRQSIELAGLFEELFLMDTRGQVVMSTDTAQEGKVYTEKTYFQRGLQAPYVQPPFYSPSLHRTSIIIARPVTDEQGQVLGVLAGRASMDKLSAVMNERAGLGETGETYLVGANKALLTQLRFAETGTGYARTEGINAAIDNHVNGSGLYDDYRGVPIVGVYRWLSELEVALLAEQNQSEAFRAIYLTMGINLGVTLFAVIVAVAVGQLVTRNIADPLADLTAMATQFTAGDLTARAHAASRDDEIGALATAFNTMAARVGELLTGLENRGQELQARTREIEASQRVTFAASERTTPDALLNLVVNLMRDQFHLYHAQVYIVDDEQQTAVLRQSTGYAGRRLLQRKHHIPLNQPTFVTQAINEGQPVVVDDVSQTADWLPNPLLPDTRSEMVAPLKVGDRVIGALDVQDRAPGRFTPGMVTLFQSMTDQVAFLFENSDLLDRVTERTQELTIFTEQLRTSADIARQLGAILDPDLLLQQVVELIRSRFGLYHAHIYVLKGPPVGTGGDGGRQRLVVQAGSGEVGRVLRDRGHSISLDHEHSLVARAARAREPVLVTDTALESDFAPNPLLPQTRSEMAVPLLVGDKVLGVLDVQDDQPNRFTQAERDTLTTLAGQIGTALQTAGLFAQVQARLRVSQALVGAQTEEEVIAGMMAGASLYPQAQVLLALYDQEAEEPTLVAQRVSSFESGVAPVKVGARFPTSRFKLIDHLSPDEPLVIFNLSTDERVDPATRQFLTGLGVVSTAIINITVGDEQIGVLWASSAQEGYFDERKLHLYQSIAEQGAIALRSGRLFDESQRTAERLRELDILKTEFMANMSHELRTPLNSIIGYAELMLMGVSEIDPDTLEDVQAIHENGQRLLHLINDILDMAKIEAGSLALNFEQVQIAPLIDEISAKAVALLAGKPVEWTVEIEENLPPIWGDSLRLDQILNNLVSNAEKFTEEGAISLRAYTERAGDSDWVCVAIKDTGIGIAETDATKIFDRFQQVDGSSTRRAGGTGLGLAITQQLVHLHGGTIEVESRPGEGTTFTARFPVSE